MRGGVICLLLKAWTQATIQQAMQTLRDEFTPISDMRATADYRRTVLGNLLQRLWLESRGGVQTDLRKLDLDNTDRAVAA